MRDFPAYVFSQAASLPEKGSSLLGRSGTVNVGSIVPAFKNFVIVLRDSPVRRLISRIDYFSRSAIRRVMFKSPIWITPLPRRSPRWGKVHMAQFSMEIICLTGSVLRGNQQYGPA